MLVEFKRKLGSRSNFPATIGEPVGQLSDNSGVRRAVVWSKLVNFVSDLAGRIPVDGAILGQIWPGRAIFESSATLGPAATPINPHMRATRP